MSHKKFKLFHGGFEDGKFSKALMAEMKEFSKHDKMEPKSIGVAVIEHRNEVVVSLGYAEKKSKIHADFKFKSLGTLADGIDKLGLKAEKEAAKMENIICHELFIDKEEKAHMIFMVGKAV